MTDFKATLARLQASLPHVTHNRQLWLHEHRRDILLLIRDVGSDSAAAFLGMQNVSMNTFLEHIEPDPDGVWPVGE